MIIWTLTGKKHHTPRSCKMLKLSRPSSKDGVYTIYPDGKTEKRVYCDMTTDKGGWTVR